MFLYFREKLSTAVNEIFETINEWKLMNIEFILILVVDLVIVIIYNDSNVWFSSDLVVVDFCERYVDYV